MTTDRLALLGLALLTGATACGDLSPLRPVPTPTTPQTALAAETPTHTAYRTAPASSVGALAWELERLDASVFLDDEVDVDGSYVVEAGPAELEWSGRRVRGTFEVVSTPTERGVWIERKGREIFALIQDAPRQPTPELDAGQQVQVREATLRTPHDLETLPGDTLDAPTRRRLQHEDLVLVIEEDDLRIVASQ